MFLSFEFGDIMNMLKQFMQWWNRTQYIKKYCSKCSVYESVQYFETDYCYQCENGNNVILKVIK